MTTTRALPDHLVEAVRMLEQNSLDATPLRPLVEARRLRR